MLHTLLLVILIPATLNYHVDARWTGRDAFPKAIRTTLVSRLVEEKRIVAREDFATQEQGGYSATVAITQNCSPDQLKSQFPIDESGGLEQLSTREVIDYEDSEFGSQDDNEATLLASASKSEGVSPATAQEFHTNDLALDPMPDEQPDPKACPSPETDGFTVSFVEFAHKDLPLDALHQGILLTRIQKSHEIFLDVHRTPQSKKLEFRHRQPFSIALYKVNRQKIVGFIVPPEKVGNFFMIAKGVVARENGNCQHWVADVLDEARRLNAMLF